jgi:RNA polymerase sigma-70 factor, ECF subfamily
MPVSVPNVTHLGDPPKAPGNARGDASSTHGCSMSSAAAMPPRDAIAALLVQNFPRAWRVARRMGLGAAEAEEVAQEAFIVYLQKADQILAGCEVAFLLSTVANLAQNHRRKFSHCREQSVSPELIDLVTARTRPDELLERKLETELLDRILSRMSEPLRVVFVLSEIEQVTLKQIAEMLEIPLGTVGSRLRLARVAFQRSLERIVKRDTHFLEQP